MQIRFFTLEGNIGAGKTTLLNKFPIEDKETSSFLLWPGTRIAVVHEPVDLWTKRLEGEKDSILEKFYTDKNRWALTFQLTTLTTRFQRVKGLIERIEGKYGDTCKELLILMERSYVSDKHIFASLLKTEGAMKPFEYDIYEEVLKSFTVQHPLSGVIYLASDVETSKKGIKERGRKGEEGITDEYLAKLDTKHKIWKGSTDLSWLEIFTRGEKPGATARNAVGDIIAFMTKN